MLRVATYNIRKCVGLDWVRRPERILSVIGELRADVVALQEADRRFGGRPATLPMDLLIQRTGLKAVTLGDGTRSSGHHGNAILVREDAVIHRVTPLDLPSLEPRGALIADLSIDGAMLRVAGVHLGLRATDRARQARALVRALEDARDPLPTIVLGDVNEWTPLGAAGAEMCKAFQPSRPLASFHTSVPVAPLDRIFVGPGVSLGAVRVHRSITARRASDHLPLYAEVSLADAATAVARSAEAGEGASSNT
ncbi:endonuclease/exonuclease/phosphatase family protein [Limibaculum sp. M0105]|uniref:Endonuclease/exonuclease/phosphatase family protein n=1 Tax=Thermohalobaculum xanthum TaxID=2753746 RepID=A0A8J7SBD0_9RHOB|nr:endonuclease/exonuclease/phosphatase family protein [Thermohalobaculum xanthum]MBK0398308.1 endonuclease/exonuclease/phosphatase family protein [Thermohalobaculum xanthum]